MFLYSLELIGKGLVSEVQVVSYFIWLLKTNLFQIQAAGKWIAMMGVIQSPVPMQS